MCIILHTTKKLGLPSDNRLEDNFISNPDGAGYAIVYTKKNGQKKIEHRKAFDNFDLYNRAVKKAFTKLKEDDDYMILHMRIATSGGTDLSKTHPFKTKDGTLIFQNGVCPVSITSKLAKNESDTEWIAKNYIDADWVKTQDSISRWVIIEPDGTLIKHGSWHKDSGGRSWSNGGYAGYSYSGYGYGYGYGYGNSYRPYSYEKEDYVFERDVLETTYKSAYQLIRVLKDRLKFTYVKSMKAISVSGHYIHIDKAFGHEYFEGAFVVGELSRDMQTTALLKMVKNYTIYTRNEDYPSHTRTAFVSSNRRFIQYVLEEFGHTGENISDMEDGDFPIRYYSQELNLMTKVEHADLIVDALNNYFESQKMNVVAIKHRKSINIQTKPKQLPTNHIRTIENEELHDITLIFTDWLREMGVVGEKVEFFYGYTDDRVSEVSLSARFITEAQSEKILGYKTVRFKASVKEKAFYCYDDFLLNLYVELYEERE